MGLGHQKPPRPPTHLVKTALTDYCTKPGAVAPRAHPRAMHIERTTCDRCVSAWKAELENRT